MGAWFASFLRSNGYQVIISDKNRSAARRLARKEGFRFLDDQGLAVRSGQLIILATPTKVTRRLMEGIPSRLPSGALVVEISSVKESMRRVIQKLQKRNVPVLSIHPMFGPGSRTVAGKAVIIVSSPARNILANRFLALLRKRGARLVRSDFEEHDKLASVLLALPHFVNVAFVNTLRAIAHDLNRTREMAGTTFKLQLLTAEEIYEDDLDNEVSILADSKHSLNVLEEFGRQTTVTVNIIKKGNRKRTLRNLRGGRDYLEKDRLFASAYKRFNLAVEASSLS